MYRLAPAELTEAKPQVTDLLERGLIEPSTSAFGSPILFVKKTTGELRMVVDYRALNKLTVKTDTLSLELMTCLTNCMLPDTLAAWMQLLAFIKSC